MGTIRLVLVAVVAAAWVGGAAFTISELCTVKPSIDTIARQQKATPVYVVPLAQNDAPAR